MHLETRGFRSGAARSARAKTNPTSSCPISRCPGSTVCPRSKSRTKSSPDTPFIFLSGTIGEERAIDALQRGAYDYVLKTNMARLVPAVRRALNEASIRRARSRSNSSCATSSPPRRTGSGSTTATASSRSAATPCAARSVMRPRKSSAPMLRNTCTPKISRRSTSPCIRSAPNQRTASNLQARWRHRNGSYRWLERNMLALLGENGQVTGFRGSERDFTERRRQEKHISRLTRVLKMLSGVNSAMVRIRQRREILVEACRLATAVGGYASAMVALDRARHAHRAADGMVGQRRQPGRAAAHLQHRRYRRRRLERHRPRAAHRRVAGLQRPATARHGARRARLAHGLGVPQRRRLSTAGRSHAGRRADAHGLRRRRGRATRSRACCASSSRTCRSRCSTSTRKTKSASCRISIRSPVSPSAGCSASGWCARSSRGSDGAARRRSRCSTSSSSRAINDSFGRHAGDLLLQQVADRLKRHLDSTELLAHFGGGTFGLIMEAAGDEDEAVHWMQEQVAEVFRAPFVVDGRGIPVDVKCGFARYPDNGNDANALVQNAEARVAQRQEHRRKISAASPRAELGGGVAHDHGASAARRGRAPGVRAALPDQGRRAHARRSAASKRWCAGAIRKRVS